MIKALPGRLGRTDGHQPKNNKTQATEKQPSSVKASTFQSQVIKMLRGGKKLVEQCDEIP